MAKGGKGGGGRPSGDEPVPNNDPVIYGTEDHDSIIAGDGDNVIYGLGGDDNINGGAGTDTIYGGDGADSLRFSLGNDTNEIIIIDEITYKVYESDTYDGGANRPWRDGALGGDWLTFYDANSVTIDLDAGTYTVYTVDSNGENAIVYGENGDFINIEGVGGSNGDDTIIGADTPDTDGNGNYLGDHVLSGGGGEDYINGQGGRDIIYGDYDDDTLIGGAGADIISGGGGNDIMTGGAEGGSGDGDADIFHLGGSSGHDTITDYEAGIDFLRFWNTPFDDLRVTDTGDDLVVEWGRGKNTNSVTLLDTDEFTYIDMDGNETTWIDAA